MKEKLKTLNGFIIKFLKDNWFKVIITFLLICLVNSLVNYINIQTRYVVQKHNFSIFKWVIDKNLSKSYEIIYKRFNL